jgi:hypothetical protein
VRGRGIKTLVPARTFLIGATLRGRLDEGKIHRALSMVLSVLEKREQLIEVRSPTGTVDSWLSLSGEGARRLRPVLS